MAKYRPEFLPIQTIAKDLAAKLVYGYPPKIVGDVRRYFVHGSSTGAWSGKKIRLNASRTPLLDFGPGFYTFEDTKRARQNAIERGFQTRSHRTGIEFLLRVSISKVDFESLAVVDFVGGNRKNEYEEVVQGFRDGNVSEFDDEIQACDVLIGRTARLREVVKKGGIGWESNPDLPIQYCFRSQKAIDLLVPESLYPCDCWYEEQIQKQKR